MASAGPPAGRRRRTVSRRNVGGSRRPERDRIPEYGWRGARPHDEVRGSPRSPADGAGARAETAGRPRTAAYTSGRSSGPSTGSAIRGRTESIRTAPRRSRASRGVRSLRQTGFLLPRKPREGIEPPGNGSAVRRINHSATSARLGRGGPGIKPSGPGDLAPARPSHRTGPTPVGSRWTLVHLPFRGVKRAVGSVDVAPGRPTRAQTSRGSRTLGELRSISPPPEPERATAATPGTIGGFRRNARGPPSGSGLDPSVGRSLRAIACRRPGSGRRIRVTVSARSGPRAGWEPADPPSQPAAGAGRSDRCRPAGART